jgi:poly-gamma-glutamate capsule biosynthesis protein CapA/YwtB (metallophosphatase superfamily)
VLATAAAVGAVLTYLAVRPIPMRPSFTFSLEAVDEAGRPVRGAALVTADGPRRTGSDGSATVSASTVVAGVLRAQGYLAEPLVLGPESDGRVVTVRLWSSRGGRRVSYHAAGDVMIGRRFLDPLRGAATARLDRARLESGARRLVAEVAPLLSSATFTTVNLETVVGDLPRGAAAAGKDLVIQTPPGALAALDALGIDAAFGANNHARDFGDAGIASTRRALAARGIAYGGAGADPIAASRPVRLGRKARLVVLSFSGLTGDSLNDALPRSSPAGTAWRRFRALEHRDPNAAGAAWPVLAARYAALQDWVARRGHGGASLWDPQRSPALIRAAAQGGSPVVVQLHRGLQYADAPPQRLLETARAAVDAGADIVVAHHPHVLQGFEWYRGSLIAFSLGNFLFDQNLLATYPGGFLRTVWDGDRLLEARFVPTMLVGYRPLPVAGGTASRLLRRLAAASSIPARSSRRNRSRTALLWRPLAPGSAAVGEIERNTLLLGRRSPRGRVEPRVLRAGQVVPLARDRLYDWGARAAPRYVLAGSDVFGYGSFDDDVAGEPDGVVHWKLGASATREQRRGNGYLVLRCGTRSHRTRLARPVSRIQIGNATLTAHAPHAYELRFRVRLAGASKAGLRLDFYRFDAGGLSIRTRSVRLARRAIQIDVDRDGRWHDIAVSIDAPVGADFVLPSFSLTPAGAPATLALDDVALVEWRRAEGPTYPHALDYVRNTGAAAVRVRLVAHPLVRRS